MWALVKTNQARACKMGKSKGEGGGEKTSSGPAGPKGMQSMKRIQEIHMKKEEKTGFGSRLFFRERKVRDKRVSLCCFFKLSHYQNNKITGWRTVVLNSVLDLSLR